MSETTVRWTIDERYGDGPWVEQASHVMTEAEAESQVMLLHGFRRAFRDGRISWPQIERYAADLLGLDLDTHRALPVSERLAIVMALGAGDAAQ